MKARQLACVATIHQPSYSILRQFDRLLLLANGETVYFGTVADAIPYFENLNVAVSGNPAEVYAEVLAAQPDEFVAAYAKSDLKVANDKVGPSHYSKLFQVLTPFVKYRKWTKFMLAKVLLLSIYLQLKIQPLASGVN